MPTKATPRAARIKDMRPLLRKRVAGAKRVVEKAPVKKCDDACALNAFQAWHDVNMTPSYNWELDFSGDLPQGKRVVIELVTALIQVPAGESARLRMFTGLGGWAGNFDLAVTPQGVANGQALFVATQALRAYTDGFLGFNINRDNAITSGNALVCVTGYVVS